MNRSQNVLSALHDLQMIDMVHIHGHHPERGRVGFFLVIRRPLNWVLVSESHLNEAVMEIGDLPLCMDVFIPLRISDFLFQLPMDFQRDLPNHTGSNGSNSISEIRMCMAITKHSRVSRQGCSFQ
jgi:hypothetical protein